jgi:acyl-CoA thioesterase-1
MSMRTCLFSVLLPWLCLAQPAGSERTIVIFGDSITEGGALPLAQRDSLWVRQVERESAGTLRLVNEGKGGRSTGSVAEFEQMLKRQPKMDALVIALGMNDSRDVTPECVPKAVRHVRAMIEKARLAHGASLPVLLAGPTNINKGALGPSKPIANERETNLKALGEAFAKLATETHSEYVSLYGIVPESSLLKDGVHPDAAGNAAITKVMGEKLRVWMGGKGK